jgi:hypothetical protein
MTNGAQRLRMSFVEVGQGFSGILLCSWALRWMVPKTVLGAVCLVMLYLAAKPTHVGADVDRASLLLSYPVFMPKPCTHRMHDPGSIVPYIRPKMLTYNQMSQIMNIYYIDNVSKD